MCDINQPDQRRAATTEYIIHILLLLYHDGIDRGGTIYSVHTLITLPCDSCMYVPPHPPHRHLSIISKSILLLTD